LLLQRTATISDSPLIEAIITEAADHEDRLIRSVWDLIITVISMDRNPAVTLSTVQSQWQNLEDAEVEAALFNELSLYNAAVDLLGTKPFCSFEDRVSNILRCRTTAHINVKLAFETRLDLDQLDLIDLTWDDVWDRVIDAEAAAARKHSKGLRPPPGDHPPTNHIVMSCVLHGQCGHETDACHVLRQHPKIKHDAVRKMKHHGICVIGYCEGALGGDCGRPGCKFKHLPLNKTDALLEQPIKLLATEANRAANAPADTRIAHPAIEAPPILGSPAYPLPAPDDDMFASYAMVEYAGEED